MAEHLVKQLPVVVALLHGVHDNEISSGEAAMAEAYHLLAAHIIIVCLLPASMLISFCPFR